MGLPTNPVPTAGELRDAWRKGRRVVEPALPYVRRGVYFGLGLGLLVGLTVHALRHRSDSDGYHQWPPYRYSAEASRQGEDAVRVVRANPTIEAVAERLKRFNRSFAAKIQRRVDDTHDTIEEFFGRLDQLPTALRRRVAGMFKNSSRSRIDKPES